MWTTASSIQLPVFSCAQFITYFNSASGFVHDVERRHPPLFPSSTPPLSPLSSSLFSSLVSGSEQRRRWRRRFGGDGRLLRVDAIGHTDQLQLVFRQRDVPEIRSCATIKNNRAVSIVHRTPREAKAVYPRDGWENIIIVYVIRYLKNLKKRIGSGRFTTGGPL